MAAAGSGGIDNSETKLLMAREQLELLTIQRQIGIIQHQIEIERRQTEGEKRARVVEGCLPTTTTQKIHSLCLKTLKCQNYDRCPSHRVPVVESALCGYVRFRDGLDVYFEVCHNT
jgi:hypothetical protein